MACVEVTNEADLSALEAKLRDSGKLECSEPAGGHFAEIQVNNRELRDVSTDCLKALRRSNEPPYLFVRAGAMVQVSIDEDGRSSILPVSESYLRGCLTRCSNFYRVAGADGAIAKKATNPPLDVIRDILSRPQDEWGSPPLIAVTEAPVLRPDGSILVTPGYDVALRMVYAPAPGLAVQQIPTAPNAEELRAAVTLIDDAIGQFPFVDQASRANASPHCSRLRLGELWKETCRSPSSTRHRPALERHCSPK